MSGSPTPNDVFDAVACIKAAFISAKKGADDLWSQDEAFSVDVCELVCEQIDMLKSYATMHGISTRPLHVFKVAWMKAWRESSDAVSAMKQLNNPVNSSAGVECACLIDALNELAHKEYLEACGTSSEAEPTNDQRPHISPSDDARGHPDFAPSRWFGLETLITNDNLRKAADAGQIRREKKAKAQNLYSRTDAKAKWPHLWSKVKPGQSRKNQTKAGNP